MVNTDKFYKDLMIYIDRELEAESESEVGTSKEIILSKRMIDDLSSGAAPAIRVADHVFRYENASSTYKINGYGIDDVENLVTVFITVLFDSPDVPQRLYRSDFDNELNKLKNFVEQSVKNPKGMLDIIHEDNDAYDLVYYLMNDFQKVDNFNFVLLTNGIVGEISFPKKKIAGKAVNITVFDIERYRRYSEGKSVTEIIADMDILKRPISCSQVESSVYDTYCCILPGDVIFNLFDAYHYQLLNSNVRTYLQLRGNVNKGIMETIQNNPEYFLAYNNGISATAKDIEVNEYGQIIKMVDFQIVNGGQTASSIYNAKSNKDFDISKINVMAKITVIHDSEASKYGEIVKNISKYANTQNAIKFSDFSSTEKYNTELAKYSRSTYTPVIGSKLQSKWYYENVAGTYNNEKIDSPSPAAFEKEYPKTQYFNKTDMAAYELAYQGFPAVACKGAQDAYKIFSTNFQTLEKPTEITFRNLVAKKILFDTVSQMIKEEIGGQGIKHMTKYVVAYFATISCKNRFNLDRVWANQSIQEESVLDDLRLIIHQMCPILTKKAFEDKKSIEMCCRNQGTWEAIKNKEFKVNNSELYSDGVEINPQLTTKLLPQSVASFVLIIDSSIWIDIMSKLDLISPDTKSKKSNYGICQAIVNTPKELLTEKQFAFATKVIIKMYEAGYSFPPEIEEKYQSLSSEIEMVKKSRVKNYSTSTYYVKAAF